jgi:hypothetical protein
MKTQLVITDVTRMQEGRVCIAGYDKNLKDVCYDPTSVRFIKRLKQGRRRNALVNVYTFPDYLDGRTFADLAPK